MAVQRDEDGLDRRQQELDVLERELCEARGSAGRGQMDGTVRGASRSKDGGGAGRREIRVDDAERG